VAGQVQPVRTLLAATSADRWTAQTAHYGHGPQALPGTLVIGQGLAVLPWHQRGPASVHQRLAQYGRRQAHLARKHPRQRPDAARQTDPWVVLFTSHPTWLAAVRSYDRRWATEGSYRDAQSGWDGQHGWDLEVALARLSDAVVVERVVGLWALGALVQTWVGHRLGQRSAAAPVPLLRASGPHWPAERLGTRPVRPDRSVRSPASLAASDPGCWRVPTGCRAAPGAPRTGSLHLNLRHTEVAA